MDPEIDYNWRDIFKNCKIYLYNLNNVLRDIADSLILDGQYRSHNDISKKLGINPRSFYYSIRGERPIDIDFFLKILSLRNYNLGEYLSQNKIKNIVLGAGTRRNLVALPLKINSDMAYLVGYLFGDGCIKSKKWTINFCDEYPEQINLINDLFLKLFNINGTTRKTDINRYELDIYSKVLSIFFNRVFEMPVGTKGEISVPILLKTSHTLRLSFLRGFSDADAGLPRIEEYKLIPNWIRKSSNIEIASKHNNILIDLREILSSQDISSNLYYHKTNDSFRLTVSGKNNISKCKDFKMFIHPIKKERLSTLVKIM